MASIYDLSSGGDFDVVAEGEIPVAELDSTTLTGSVVTYLSNTLQVDVDGDAASRIPSAFSVFRRTIVQSDCTGSRRDAIIGALPNCASLASAAANAAASGSSAK